MSMKYFVMLSWILAFRKVWAERKIDPETFIRSRSNFVNFVYFWNLLVTCIVHDFVAQFGLGNVLSESFQFEIEKWEDLQPNRKVRGLPAQLKSERISNQPELLDASSTSLGRAAEVDQLVSLQESKIKIKKLSGAARDQNGNHEHYLELQEIKIKITIIIKSSSPSSLQQSSLASRSAAAWPRRTLPWTEGPSPCPSCRCPSSEGPGSGLWEFLLNQTIM